MLATRPKPGLDSIVSFEQKAYITGRFISECTRTTYDMYQHAKENNMPGMSLMIYLENTFDAVSFKFIVTTLAFFILVKTLLNG